MAKKEAEAQAEQDTVTVQFLATTRGYQRGQVATIPLDARADGLLRDGKAVLAADNE